MTLKEQINFLAKYRYEFISLILFFGLIGMLVHYVVPRSYIATGTLFVTRRIEDTQDLNFGYEGFYAQQSAQTYTSSLISIVESDNLLANVAKEMKLAQDEKNIRYIARQVSTKKQGPQTFEITTKGKTYEQAKTTWELVTQQLAIFNAQITQEADPNIKLVILDNSPIVTKTYSNPALNFLIGGFLGFFIGLLAFSLEEYLQVSTTKKSK